MISNPIPKQRFQPLNMSNRFDQDDLLKCRVNAIGISELFQKYYELNFLYDAKLKRLRPYLTKVQQNWEQALAAGRQLLEVYTCDDTSRNAWASMVVWKTTNNGVWSQHLISSGNPLASRSVMLKAQIEVHKNPVNQSAQNWFRSNNRMPMKIFGSIEQAIGSDCASVREYHLLEIPLSSENVAHHGLEVTECDPSHTDLVTAFAQRVRGHVYVEAESLNSGDLDLEETDRLYQDAGLRRYRKVWLTTNNRGEVIASLIAHRGPLGLNFSFLENRADLLIAPEAEVNDSAIAVQNMVAAASQYYRDFERSMIPIVVCDRGAELLQHLGAQSVRKYCQSLWTRDGFRAWYDHTNSFYQRIVQRLAERATISSY